MSPLDSGPAPGIADSTFGYTHGGTQTATEWPDRRTATWPQLARMLTTHQRGAKEGSCFTPATFRGTRRHKADADQIDLVVLDADCGHTLDEIETAVRARGWAAIVHSTHSHLTTRTTVAKGNWAKFSAANQIGAEPAFLIDKGYLPRVAEGARIVNDDGEHVTFEHQPCPKFRIVLRLARPWRAADYPDQNTANAAWKERIEALAAALGLSHDQSCTDTSRLFFLPRHPGDAARPPVALVIEGADCDIWTLPRAAPATDDGLFGSKRTGTEDAGDYTDPNTGECIDLRQWARDRGRRFEIVKALRARKPDAFVGHVADGGHHHIRCVNEDAHTNAGADRATFIVNASEAGNKGFVYHCRHAHCTDHDRLFFVRQMLASGWLKVDDLTAPAFLCEGASEAESARGSGGHEDWPAPARDLASADTLPPPELPLQGVFPAGWASWIEAAAESKGAPPDYVATALLSVAGALIGNARWANPWDGWAEPPAINAALIGNPSAGKSPALDALVSPLAEIEAADNEDWKERKRGHLTDKLAADEHRARWEKDAKEAVKHGNPPPLMPADAEEPAPPQRRRILSTDPTVAKAERLSAANVRGMVLVRDELAGWIAGMDRFSGGGDRQFWLQSYGGRHWTPDRVKDGDAEISVPHLTWSIVGGIQPDRLASAMLAGDDDGLAARFLYTWPSPQAPTRPRPGLDVGRAQAWLARLRALPWTPPAPLLVPFDRGAQAALQEWREEVARMEEGSSGLFLSWLGKLPGFAVRLALIFAHLDWCEHGRGDPPGEVREADALRALAFLSDYAIPMARRCFGEAALPEVERDARRLSRWLLRRQPIPKTLNVRELRRMQDGPGIATADRLKAALEELAGLGWVRSTPARDGAPGRQRNDWTVNPELSGGAAHGLG